MKHRRNSSYSVVKNYRDAEQVRIVFWHNPENNKIAPLPDWGSKDLKLGTFRAVIRQLGLDWQEFLNAK